MRVEECTPTCACCYRMQTAHLVYDDNCLIQFILRLIPRDAVPFQPFGVAYVRHVKKRNLWLGIKHLLLPCWDKIISPICQWSYPATMPKSTSMMTAIRLIRRRKKYSHPPLHSWQPAK